MRFDTYNLSFAPQRALLNIDPSTTDGLLVARVADRKLVVLQVIMVCGTDPTDITFCTMDGSSVPISPLFANAGNGGAVLPFSQTGWFETRVGEDLCVTSSAGSAVGILISYLEA